MQITNTHRRIAEYFGLTYFNWLIIVPLLTPWVLFVVKFTDEQYWIWFSQSFIISLVIGWFTVKCDAKFEPWFKRKLGLSKQRCNKCGK